MYETDKGYLPGQRVSIRQLPAKSLLRTERYVLQNIVIKLTSQQLEKRIHITYVTTYSRLSTEFVRHEGEFFYFLGFLFL